MSESALRAKQIDALPAGHELDDLVAEKVMGWIPYVDGDEWTWGDPEGHDFPRVPSYSIEIAAAWLVWEKVMTLPKVPEWVIAPLYHPQAPVARYPIRTPKAFVIRGWEIQEVSCEPYEGCALITVVEADTAPLAICRAALRALLFP